MSVARALVAGRWVAVWRRNYLVWRKLAAVSIAGNIIDPLFYLLGFGLGFATMIPEVEGVKYIAFLAGGTICYTTMLAASFEALYSGFARMHVQRTWEGILAAPVGLEDVVLAEWIWAASKSLLSGTAILLVAIALGLSQSWTMAFIVPLALLIGLAFAGMGLVMTALAKSYDFFTYWFTLVLTPQMLLCGVFFPTSVLPGGCRRWLPRCRSRTPSRSAGRSSWATGPRGPCCTRECSRPTVSPASRSPSRSSAGACSPDPPLRRGRPCGREARRRGPCPAPCGSSPRPRGCSGAGRRRRRRRRRTGRT